MLLQLFDTVEAQTRLFVSFEQAVHEVHCLHAPSQWQVPLRDLGLMGKDFISDFLAGIAEVGSLSDKRGTDPSIIS